MSETKPNVILLTVDSLRADSILENSTRTPTLDALRERGTTYTAALSQGPFTTFSMPSLFTSRYPSGLKYATFSESTVGVYIDEETTIQHILKSEGYETTGFHSNPLLSELFGFGAGFDTFDAQLPLSGVDLISGRGKILTDKILRLIRKHPYLPAEKLTAKGVSWLNRRRTESPFFMWLHYMDVHGPYQSKSGNTYLNKFKSERLWRKAVTDPESITNTERERLRTWYREEIEYTDSCIGTLLKELERRGEREDTVVIVTADHGEQFREHGHFSHPHQLYEELINVPLIVSGPGFESTTIDKVVELVDVAPSIGEVIGASTPESFVGDPLPREGGARSDPEFKAISEADLVPDYTGCVRTENWKYIREGGTDTLFDLTADPTEQTDVSDNHNDVSTRLANRLDEHLSGPQRDVGADRSVATVDIDSADTEERLRDLGYLE